MEIVITSSPDEAAHLVADAIERLTATVARPVLGLATGSSPLPIYRELIERHRRGEVSFATTRAFLLDEYVGLPIGHPEAYRAFIQREFTDHVDLPPDELFGPDGTSADLGSAGREYEERIGGAGLQLDPCPTSSAHRSLDRTSQPETCLVTDVTTRGQLGVFVEL